MKESHQTWPQNPIIQVTFQSCNLDYHYKNWAHACLVCLKLKSENIAHAPLSTFTDQPHGVHYYFSNVLTTGAAGEAICVIQVPHGLASLAGAVHTLPTLHADTCLRNTKYGVIIFDATAHHFLCGKDWDEMRSLSQLNSRNNCWTCGSCHISTRGKLSTCLSSFNNVNQ